MLGKNDFAVNHFGLYIVRNYIAGIFFGIFSLNVVVMKHAVGFESVSFKRTEVAFKLGSVFEVTVHCEYCNSTVVAENTAASTTGTLE